MDRIHEYKPVKGFIITDHYYADVLRVANIKKLIKDGVLFDIDDVKDLVRLGYLSSPR